MCATPFAEHRILVLMHMSGDLRQHGKRALYPSTLLGVPISGLVCFPLMYPDSLAQEVPACNTFCSMSLSH